jgi:hypothetical protein
MDKGEIAIDALKAFTRVLECALEGDKRSQERLKDIVPPESYTQLIKLRQDKLDDEKFGPRS